VLNTYSAPYVNAIVYATERIYKSFVVNDFRISTDKDEFDFEVIFGFITNSYWAKGIPREVMRKAIDNSLCFGVFEGNNQVGFGRVITDGATFGYLADVFVLESHRGLGLSKMMMIDVVAHPDLQGVRRLMLATYDAHSLYRQFGFKDLSNPSNMMEICDPDIYQKL